MTDDLFEVELDDDKAAAAKAAEAKDDDKGKKDPPKEDEIKVEAAEDKPPAAKVITPEEGIEALKSKLEQERTARVEAERRQRDADARVTQATKEVQDNNLQMVTSAMETLKQSTEALKTRYKEARTNNDFDAEIEVQRELAKNEARMIQLEAGKQALEKRAKEPTREAPADPVERLASQLSARSATWVRQHPEFARDERQYNRMIAAHQLAVGDGLVPDTDDYFTALETTLKLRKQEERTEEEEQPRRAAPAAAPPSRSSGSPSGRTNVVRLTKDEREMAQMMGMSDQEYAKNKLALQQEGKLK